MDSTWEVTSSDGNVRQCSRVRPRQTHAHANSRFHVEYGVFDHLHSHGRPSPRWSARMSPFGLEPHNTNPRIHWNGGGGVVERSKVTKQSNRSKCVTAIHNPFTHSHYLPSALKLPLIHLSITVRGTQRQSRPPSINISLTQNTDTCTHTTTLERWLPALPDPKCSL